MSCVAFDPESCPEHNINFSQVHIILDNIKNELGNKASNACENQEAEEFIEERGRALLCAMHQAFIDAKTSQQIVDPVVDATSSKRTDKRKGAKRGLTGLFGTVEVQRDLFRKNASESLAPMDGHLNLPLSSYSFALQRRAIQLGCVTSYEKAQELLQMLTGTHFPKRQIEQALITASKDFKSFYRCTNYPLECFSPEDLLILTFDGKGIKMRTEDLREQTKNKPSKHRIESRNSPGEKNGKKRMAQVGAVYCVAPYNRSAEDFLRSLQAREHTPKNNKPRRPKPTYKQVFAGIEDGPERIIQLGFMEAERRDPKHKMKCIVLVDGDPHQIKKIESMAQEYKREIVLYVDFIHLAQYIWKAGHAFFGSVNTKEKEEWVFTQLEKVLRGKAGYVSAGIDRKAKMLGLSSKQREPVDKCCRYIRNHLKYLRYNNALRIGSPICTGVIEGACRYLVRDRMELTGCRWGLNGAEAMLRLRAIYLTGDFAEYWAFHCEQEKKRNHLNNYNNGTLPRIEESSTGPTLTLIKGGKSETL